MVFDVFLIASTGEYNIYKKRVRDIPQLCKRKKMSNVCYTFGGIIIEFNRMKITLYICLQLRLCNNKNIKLIPYFNKIACKF